MGDATDMEHDTEEGPGGDSKDREEEGPGEDATIREDGPRYDLRHRRRACGDTIDTE